MPLHKQPKELKESSKTCLQKLLRCTVAPYRHQTRVQQVQVPKQSAMISLNLEVYLYKENVVSIEVDHVSLRITH